MGECRRVQWIEDEIVTESSTKADVVYFKFMRPPLQQRIRVERKPFLLAW